MLEVLRHHDLEGVLATVVRYFGGVKLGAGGLVRAYTDAVAQALQRAEKVPLRRLCTQQCAVPYAMEGWMRRQLEQSAAVLLAVEHQTQVKMQWQIAEDAMQSLTARINEAGQGRVAWLEHW